MLNFAIGAVKVLYKNMVYKRPKYGPHLVAVFALLTSLNMWVQIPEKYLANLFLIFAFILWFFVLPLVIFILDHKNDPERIKQLIRMTPNFY